MSERPSGGEGAWNWMRGKADRMAKAGALALGIGAVGTGGEMASDVMQQMSNDRAAATWATDGTEIDKASEERMAGRNLVDESQVRREVTREIARKNLHEKLRAENIACDEIFSLGTGAELVTMKNKLEAAGMKVDGISLGFAFTENADPAARALKVVLDVKLGDGKGTSFEMVLDEPNDITVLQRDPGIDAMIRDAAERLVAESA